MDAHNVRGGVEVLSDAEAHRESALRISARSRVLYGYQLTSR